MKESVFSRVNIIISDFGVGGAERMAIELAQQLVRHGFKVRIICISFSQSKKKYPKPTGIEIINLVEGKKLTYIAYQFFRIHRLRYLMSNQITDVNISFVTHVNIICLIAKFFTKSKLIICERSNIELEPISRFLSLLRQLLYPKSNLLVLQTANNLQVAQKLFPECTLRLIPNYIREITLSPSLQGEQVYNFGQYIVTVGRLDKKKRLDFILDAYSLLPIEYKRRFKLVIVGYGPSLEDLKHQAKELNIQSNVHFLQNVTNVGYLLSNARLFVFASVSEGFPNAVTEAVSVGLPVLTTDYHANAAELSSILENFVVLQDTANSREYSKEMQKMLKHDLRPFCKDNINRLKSEFNNRDITERWIEVIKELS